MLCVTELCSFFILTILATLKLEGALEIPWVGVSAPGILMLIPVPLLFHTIIHASSRAIGKYGVCIILACAYTWTLGVAATLCLVGLKADSLVGANVQLLFCPLWVSFLAMITFTVFMFPGLTKPKINMKRTALLMIAYTFCVIAFCITVSINLETRAIPWMPVFATLMLLAGLHGISLCWTSVRDNIPEIVWVTTLLSSSVLLAVNLDFSCMPWSTVFIPAWIMILLCTAKLASYKIKTREQQPLLPHSSTPR